MPRVSRSALFQRCRGKRALVGSYGTLDAPLPTRLYHGTSTEFSQFDPVRFGARDFGDWGFGVYLTPRAGLAKAYAYESARHTKGTPVVLVIEHTLSCTVDLDDPGVWALILEMTGIPQNKKLHVRAVGKQTRPRDEAQALTALLVNLGFDSGIARGGAEIVAYDLSKLHISRAVPADDKLFFFFGV